MTGVDVRAEQVRTVYRQTAPILLTNCVNAAIVSAVLWSPESWPVLVGWMLLMGAMCAGRFELSRRYQRANPASAQAAPWATRFVLGSATAGALWGGAGFLLSDDASVLSQLLITFVIGGMCSAAAGSLASHLPAFRAFVAIALAGLAVRMASWGDSTHLVMAGMVLLYAGGLFAVAKLNHDVLTEAFRLRFENATLLTRLSLTQARLEETNRTLEQRVVERSDALEKQAEALRDAQRMESIGRLAGGVAHDFNNLLTVILANLSDLIRRRSLEDATRAALREMRDAATKGADLVRQLLMFSRRQRTVPETLDLNRVVRAMDRLLNRLLGAQFTLQLSLEEAPLYVFVDPTQIEQVIINLVTNARDAMAGGGVVSIETRAVELLEESEAMAPGSYVLLSVSDTGSGMDSSTRQNMFEPFFTTKELGKGTGLGLATVYGVVEQSGGHIRVSSTPHEGSCFRVYFSPAQCRSEGSVPAHAELEGPLRAPSGVRVSPSASRGATVLLVDDEPMVRAVTRRILESAGHRVLVADSAERALLLAAETESSIDLLVTDVVMSGIDGPALAERLCAQRPELRTLIMSGYSQNYVIPHDGPENRVSFLAKPFTYDSLLAKVTELLVAPVQRKHPASGN